MHYKIMAWWVKKKKKSLLSLAKKNGKKICDATEKTCILNVELVSKNYF